MIKFEKPEVWGWEHAIRGMRNPLNSWERSDSYPAVDCGKCGIIDREGICHPKEHDCTPYECYAIGNNDKDLMTRLIRGGAPHRKFLRQIFRIGGYYRSSLLVEGVRYIQGRHDS